MITIAKPLSEAMNEVSSKNDFSYAVRDFVDRFRSSGEVHLLKDEPELLSPRLCDGGVADAWVAALAESLARENGYSAPAWAYSSVRTLSKPWFAASSPAMRAILLQESPAAFRVRNLFVSANALSRA